MKKNTVILLLILLLAILLRTWGLDKVPPALFGDEVDAGYQAFSLLKTGRDYRGNLFPVYAESFAEPRAPLLFYATAPFVALFGLNEWGVRFPSAFFGVLSVLTLFFLIKEVFKEEKLALISAFLLAVTPWHLSYSRTAFEVNLLLFLILFGTLSFFKALKMKLNWGLLSALSFGLTFYTYNTANIFVPLWLVFLGLFYRRQLADGWKKSQRIILLSAVLGIVLVLPIVREVIFGSAGFRFGLVSIFSDPQMIDVISFKRSFASFGSLAERFFHNKLVWWFKAFWANYLEAFSFKFLFVSGDPNPRHSLPGFGLLSLTFLPLLLIGIYQILCQKRKEFSLFVIWLVLAPISASLTIGGGSHATRLFLMLPPLEIFAALGLVFLAKNRPWKLFLIMLTPIFLFESIFYTHELIVHYPQEQFRYWHYGYKQVVLLYEKNKNLCQKIYFNNTHEPFLIRYLFWTKTDPEWFRKNFKGDRDNLQIENIFQGFLLGNAYFGRISTPDKLGGVKTLLEQKDTCYVAFQGEEIPGDWDIEKNPTSGIEVLGKINDPLGKSFIYLLH